MSTLGTQSPAAPLAAALLCAMIGFPSSPGTAQSQAPVTEHPWSEKAAFPLTIRARQALSRRFGRNTVPHPRRHGLVAHRPAHPRMAVERRTSAMLADPEFDVVAFVCEPTEVLRRFASHYLSTGARCVHIYFDGVCTQPLDCCDGRIKIINCSDDFWSLHKAHRPSTLEERQRFIYNLVYSTSYADWLLVVDADEFVVSSVPLRTLLKAASSKVNAIRFTSIEAVYGSQDDVNVPFGASLFGHLKISM